VAPGCDAVGFRLSACEDSIEMVKVSR
jgi:hypothetical protein